MLLGFHIYAFTQDSPVPGHEVVLDCRDVPGEKRLKLSPIHALMMRPAKEANYDDIYC